MLRKDALDEREADFYEALYTQSQAQFGAYVAAGTLVNNYAHIFDLLIRLRQARARAKSGLLLFHVISDQCQRIFDLLIRLRQARARLFSSTSGLPCHLRAKCSNISMQGSCAVRLAAPSMRTPHALLTDSSNGCCKKCLHQVSAASCFFIIRF